ncbi:alpha-N-arabinofuranosidase [uncultured Sphingomonas sp.]|uniref:alpha-N-arabinofuranosidase n=1 Tax=uncultured Sphingomonas sp. TaxID=158754 RepID=UPI0035CC568F
MLATSGAAAAQDASVVIHADRPGPVVHRQIFGQFAEHLGHGIYDGIWVGPASPIPNTQGFRNDVIAALRAIKVPVIRWPGGCFADEYHWREGVGPAASRPTKVNTNWGGVTEPNTVGTHEFMTFAELVGAETYVSGNVGSAPPQEMADWVEYMTSPTASTLAGERRKNGRDAPWKVGYFGLGNELWGCGGNMRAEYAADVTKRYATFVKVPAGQKMLKIASGATDDDTAWTEVMMREAGKLIDGIGVHHYTLPGDWTVKGPATGFDAAAWTHTLARTWAMDDIVTRHSAVMDKYDPQRRVWLAVDEWGTWYDPTPGSNPGFLEQENTLRDAVIAALNINIFTAHAERVKLANIAQMVNVLQAMIQTRGSAMVLTPTYHVFHMYLPWQDATRLPVEVAAGRIGTGKDSLPQLSSSAVRGTDGRLHVALVNTDPEHALPVSLRIDGAGVSRAAVQQLTAARMDARNTFAQPAALAPRDLPSVRASGGRIAITLPAKSVTVLELR